MKKGNYVGPERNISQEGGRGTVLMKAYTDGMKNDWNSTHECRRSDDSLQIDPLSSAFRVVASAGGTKISIILNLERPLLWLVKRVEDASERSTVLQHIALY
jgi:hypothetical protein